MKIISVLLIIPSICIVSACSTVLPYSYRIKPGKGGTVSLKPSLRSDPDARDNAMKIMEENCGTDKVKIIEEGFVKVQTVRNEGMGYDVFEWQIEYACKK